MAIMSTLAAIGTGLLFGAGGVAAGAAADKLFIAPGRDEAKKKADDAIAAQNTKQEELLQKQTDFTAKQESNANLIATRDQAKARQKQMALGAQGRQSTILTSPLGVAGSSDQSAGAYAPKKTLLGT